MTACTPTSWRWRAPPATSDVPLPHDPDQDDTQSFSVPLAVRAPIGVTLQSRDVEDVRGAALALAIGAIFIVLDVHITGEFGVDVVPDTVGGLAILVGTIRAARVASTTGPARAGRIAILLALLQLPLLVPADLPGAEVFLHAGTWVITADYLQGTIAALGTAVVATILSRAHDALGQFGRRQRWTTTRWVALVVAVPWIPFGLPAEFVGDDTAVVLAWFFGVTSVLMIVAGLALILLLVRALLGSVNVRSQVGWGEV